MLGELLGGLFKVILVIWSHFVAHVAQYSAVIVGVPLADFSLDGKPSDILEVCRLLTFATCTVESQVRSRKPTPRFI
jgi:hypothetical protein